MMQSSTLYDAVMPCTAARHGSWWVEAGTDYAFSRHMSCVPLVAAELVSASLEYPIVFAGTGAAMQPMALLGIPPGGNAYLLRHGRWQARYVPACLRRYPFMLASADGGKTLSLCIDEAYTGFNQSGRGHALFAPDGRPSTYVDETMAFLRDYESEYRRTEAFCAKLLELELLTEVEAEIRLRSGGTVDLHGFWVIDRDRLKTLLPDRLAELARSDILELVYSQLSSMQNLARLPARQVVEEFSG